MAIKRSSEDFVVEEILAEPLRQGVREQGGRFALYRLTKTGLTTPDAAAAVARAIGCPVADVVYAGLKDRHARTTQHVSVELPNGSASAAPKAHRGRGWSLEPLGWVDQPLVSDAIAANRFRIVVRGLTRRQCAEMDQATELLSVSEGERRSLRVVNYFGDQRFGSARHGRGFLARNLIRGEFEEALKLAIGTAARKDTGRDKRFKRLIQQRWGQWDELFESLPPSPHRRAIEQLRGDPQDFRGAFSALPYFFQRMSVEAYQSHLWNAITRRLVEPLCEHESGGIVADDPFGPMIFPAAAAITHDMLNLELPLPAPGTELIEPWKTAAEQVLADEGIALDQLRIPGLRRPFFGEAMRRLFVDAVGFEISGAHSDETETAERRFKRMISFDLPRGAYATVVLRALGQ